MRYYEHTNKFAGPHTFFLIICGFTDLKLQTEQLTQILSFFLQSELIFFPGNRIFMYLV